MDKLRNMQLFCRVVELGNFAKAAKAMNLTPAIVGRHIANLEQSLEVRLINRTTRSMEVTPAGQEYYGGCKAVLENIEVLEQSLLRSYVEEPKGFIRVAAPDGFASPYLLDHVIGFQERYPQIHIDIVADNERTDLIKDNIDLAIRFAISLEDSSYVAYPLTHTKLALFGAVKYLEEHGVPQSISDLNAHDCLHFGASRYGGFWPVIKNGETKKIKLPWKLSFSNTHIYMDALTRGLGIGLLPEIFVSGNNAGNLNKIEGVFDFHEITIYAMYPSRHYIPHRVKLFLEYLKAAYEGAS
ncbi:LysR family transcriptional regulator [Pleionea sp. CnH1-48]|uniref:LysR family transcriptional regulator n=1 Tax=Pleionea sp. CnH1-48 TaxID=2954494 RepID=UPI0020982FA1|nr:LysR family transcriptional regulator [Pleionea sp. CnH1-48]MCO7223044.1 LysR family transcriptional regulator [Pleionea sp. CnH1-48]